LNILQLILDAARDWGGTFRLAFLFTLMVVVVAVGLWGIATYILPALVQVVRSLVKGKKVTTPVGTLEDAAVPAPDAECGPPESVPLDKVDEMALAHPRDVKATVMSRQLDEMWDALRGVTQMIAGGIKEEDHGAHLAKRDHVRIVLDGQVEVIVRRLIHNGLDALADRDEEAYCKDKAERLYHAIADDLEERLLARNVDHLDLHQALESGRPVVLDRLRGMYRACIAIAKSAYRECA